MVIETICDKVTERQNAQLNSFNPAQEISVLFGRPGTGKTTLAMQIAGKAAKSGPVLFFSMELSRETVIKRLDDMQISDKNIFINDAPLIGEQSILSFVWQHRGSSVIIIDHLQFFNGDISTLVDINAKCGIPILALGQLNRSADDNPGGKASFTDVIWALTHDKSITPRTLKSIKKFSINRVRKSDCESEPNISETLIDEYDTNGISAEYKLFWNQKKCCFTETE